MRPIARRALTGAILIGALTLGIAAGVVASPTAIHQDVLGEHVAFCGKDSVLAVTSWLHADDEPGAETAEQAVQDAGLKAVDGFNRRGLTVDHLGNVVRFDLKSDRGLVESLIVVEQAPLGGHRVIDAYECEEVESNA